MAGGELSARYRSLVSSGEVENDPAQVELAARFDGLNAALAAAPGPRASLLGRLLGGRTAEAPKGLYVYGDVGRGKTMLMDAFFATATEARKRRIHFNEFMGGVHDRIHAFRQSAKDGGDPILPVAAALAAEIRLLCLDEFAVEDIADAMILSRLFGELFRLGLVLVATSNTAPEDLYRDGLNRALFLPFVETLRRHVAVFELKALADYRLAKLGRQPVYVTPLGPAADAQIDRIWAGITGGARPAPATLHVKGREVVVPEAAKGAARFGFADLCAQPLGAADFIELARAFQTVVIDNIPVIRDEQRDQARRFINLIDVLYDHGTRLVVSAAAEPEGLYTAARGEESFAFRRTVSRLVEMRSEAWLSAVRPSR